MRYYGGKTYFDEINGQLWHTLWPADYPRVFFGHIPDPDGPLRDNIVGLDGGCVFGAELRAFDSRDGQVHRVPARQQYALNEFARTANVGACESLRQREELRIAGLLRGDRSDDGTLAIYTYTDACVYTNAWDETTRNSRGHVFNLITGECVAWPFPKFFNLGENRATLPACFDWDGPYEIYEKMDGWLGVLYRHEGIFKVASRGSFHSSGAQWATAFLQEFDLTCLPEDATLCFEIISPEQRIILNYGEQKTLIVLGAFNRFTQEEYPRAQVEEWARRIGLPVVRLLPHMTLQELEVYQQREEKCEGFVIRFPDGRRVKLKTDWYLQLAKIMSNLTPIAMWEVMLEGKVQETFLRQIPEELRPLAEEYRATLEGQYARLRIDVEQTARELLSRFGDDRRALALYMNEHSKELGFRRAATFLVRDGKHDALDRLLRDQIYPRGNVFMEL
jgi:RNA ligase